MATLNRKCRTSAPKLPAWLTNQATSLLPYGASILESSSGLTADRRCQCSMIYLPASGIFSNQAGGGGALNVDNDLNQPVISSVRSRMVSTAKQTGTIKTSSSRTTITITASQRLPQSR